MVAITMVAVTMVDNSSCTTANRFSPLSKKGTVSNSKDGKGREGEEGGVGRGRRVGEGGGGGWGREG